MEQTSGCLFIYAIAPSGTQRLLKVKISNTENKNDMKTIAGLQTKASVLTGGSINTSIKMSILFLYIIICFCRTEADVGFNNLADVSKEKLPCFLFVLMCTLACTDGEFSKSLPKYTHTPEDKGSALVHRC